MKRILCLFDYACKTGFATVSHNIVREMKKYFGENLVLDIIAINYHGEDYDEDPYTRIVNGKREDPDKDPFCRKFYLKQLREGGYDGTFIIQDPNVIAKNRAIDPNGNMRLIPVAQIMKDIRDGSVRLVSPEQKAQGVKKSNPVPYKSIFYFPIDCSPLHIQLDGLGMFDKLVTYTQFGRDEVVKKFPSYANKLEIIPHGNNNKDFYPLGKDDVRSFRKSYFGEKYNGHRFIISNINRNQPRKDIPNTIFGFIEALDNWPSDQLPQPLLYLHMNPHDSEGHDLELLLSQTKLIEGKDYILLPEKYRESGGTDIETLNRIYNASNLVITTTTGEGWGLMATEAMATKTPLIAPDYSSLPEITANGERAWLLETLYPCAPLPSPMIRRQTDLYEVGDKIIEVALAQKLDTPEYQDKIKKAYEYAQGLDWSIVCKDWARLFAEVFGVKYK